MKKIIKNTTTENKRDYTDELVAAGVLIPIEETDKPEEILDAVEAGIIMADVSDEIKKDEAYDSSGKASETFEEADETASPAQEDLIDQAAPTTTKEDIKEEAETLSPAEPSDEQKPSSATSKATLAEMLKEKMSTLAVTEDASETSEISTASAAAEPIKEKLSKSSTCHTAKSKKVKTKSSLVSPVSLGTLFKPTAVLPSHLPKGLYETDDGYGVKDSRGDIKEIVNFKIKKIFRVTKKNLRGEKVLYLKIVAITKTGDEVTINAKATDLDTVSAFKSVLTKTNAEYNSGLIFRDNINDLSRLQEFIINLPSSMIESSSEIGIFENREGERLFVSTNTCVNADGNIDSSMEFVGDTILETRLTDFINSGFTEKELIDLLTNLFSLNSFDIISAILAWCSGCFLKSDFSRLGIKFPLMMINGEPGSGKSTTVDNLIKPIFSMESAENITVNSSTDFGKMKTLSDTRLVPCILEEIKWSSLSKKDANFLLGLLRDIYDEHSGARGNRNKSLNLYSYVAPVIAVSEEYINDIANIERSINVSFSKNITEGCKGDITTINADNDLNALGGMLLKAVLNTDADTIYGWYKEGLQYYADTLKGRYASNAACCYDGIRLLLSLKCSDTGRTLEELINDHETAFTVDDLFKSIGNTIFQTIPEDGESITDRMLGEMIYDEGIREKCFRIEASSGEISIWIDKALELLRQKMSKSRRSDEITDNTTFKKYLANSCYFKGKNKTKRINGDTVKAWVLDLDKVNDHIDISSLLPNNR